MTQNPARQLSRESTEVVQVAQVRGTHFAGNSRYCPHTYAARHLKNENSHETQRDTCYLAENLSRLLRFLKRQQVPLEQLEFVTLAGNEVTEVNARLYGIENGRWTAH